MSVLRTCLLGFVGLAAAVGFTGCGVDPSKIATHEVYVSDGDTLEDKSYLRFAVLGATAGAPAGAAEGQSVADEVLADVRSEIPVRGLSFAVLTGGVVRRSSEESWAAFDQAYRDVLVGETASEVRTRIPAHPLPGAGEAAGDKRLLGFGAAFDGVGQDIGYSRVASWSVFDAEVDGQTWRFITLDGRRKALGSRWNEQVFWLNEVLGEGEYDEIVVFLNAPLVTLGQSTEMDVDDGPSELIELIDGLSGVMGLRAVFAGGMRTNEVLLPSGNFGEAHFGIGTAGGPAEDLGRWGPADAAGYEDVSLEPLYDLALMKEFDRWNHALEFPRALDDKAKARGSYDGFTAVYDASVFPVVGWWSVDIDDGTVTTTFRVRRYDGTFHDAYRIRYTRSNGWTPLSSGE